MNTIYFCSVVTLQDVHCLLTLRLCGWVRVVNDWTERLRRSAFRSHQLCAIMGRLDRNNLVILTNIKLYHLA